jgi:hypothetical protein
VLRVLVLQGEGASRKKESTEVGGVVVVVIVVIIIMRPMYILSITMLLLDPRVTSKWSDTCSCLLL